VVAANLCAATAHAGRVVGLTFNAACGERYTLNHLFAQIRDVVGGNVEPTYEAARVGDVKHSQADISLARERLGYEPSVSLAEGLRGCVEFYAAARDAAGVR
jgi:nucleoside-diphosphate-sugar epimerase